MKESLERRILRLMNQHPPLRKGALGWRGLVGLANRVVHRIDARLEVMVKLRPNPFRGHVRRIGNRVTFSIDASLSRRERELVLAHEIGHVALGHYLLADEVYYYSDNPQGDVEEQEADLFEMVALRSMFVPLEWIVQPEQLPLGIPRPHVNPYARDVRAESERRNRGRVRTGGPGKPKPAVAEILRLFDEGGV